MRLEPRPRVVDWGVLVATLVALATGLGSLFAGRPSRAWVFVLHGVAGVVLVVLLGWKLRRVAPRIAAPAARDSSAAVSVLLAAAALAALATGIYWVLGGRFRVLRWNALVVHAVLGVLVLPLLLVHLRDRFHVPRRADVEGRRTALQSAALVAGGTLAWRLQQAVVAALDTPSAGRRFTGSTERGEAPGNTFPATSWVADDPAPVDPDAWELRVHGAVARECRFDRDALAAGDGLRATLDCTSGWYTTQDWAGIRIGRLLDAAGPTDDARWVSVRSVTGYRWSLPIDEARDALLATHVGGEPLSHDHGAPARLVAPGRRGFQWVKWVTAIEVRAEPDYGQWVAIFTSGFTRPRDGVSVDG